MDSKNIYISSQTHLKNITWLKDKPDTEWVYIGNDTLSIELLIDNFFDPELQLYLVTDRHNSNKVDKEQILENAKKYLGNTDFLVWN